MDFEVLDPEDGQDESQDDLVSGGPPEGLEAGAPKRRRRRRKLFSPAHEARIEAYRALVEGRGWIFAPPSPVQPVSALFKHLTNTQVESLSA